MDTGEQFVTISAVLLGALMTHVTNYMLERSRNRHQLLTRWDDKKLDAYEGYADRVRAGIFLAVQPYEDKKGIRESHESESKMLAEMYDASRLRGRALARVMLLGGDEVVEAATGSTPRRTRSIGRPQARSPERWQTGAHGTERPSKGSTTSTTPLGRTLEYRAT